MEHFTKLTNKRLLFVEKVQTIEEAFQVRDTIIKYLERKYRPKILIDLTGLDEHRDTGLFHIAVGHVYYYYSKESLDEVLFYNNKPHYIDELILDASSPFRLPAPTVGRKSKKTRTCVSRAKVVGSGTKTEKKGKAVSSKSTRDYAKRKGRFEV